MVLWPVIFSECWSITWAISWCQREFCSSQGVHNMKKCCMRFWIFMDSLKIQGFTETLFPKIFDFLIFLYNVTLLGKLSMNYVVFFIAFSWTIHISDAWFFYNFMYLTVFIQISLDIHRKMASMKHPWNHFHRCKCMKF